MREILFRGKRLDNGEWLEGLLMAYHQKVAQIGTFTDFGHYVRCDRSLGVDPATVGQYTGLKDKNGKRIFEGDVVTIPGSNKCGLPAQIHYYQRRGAFVIARIGYNPICLEDAEEWCEVIGNIHDNPELLKGGAFE